MTEYRSINDGYNNYLEYLYEYKYLFFFTKHKWQRIWKPYYDTIYGRDIFDDSDLLVCGRNNALKDFVKKWPDIQDYFEWANHEQDKLVKKSDDWHTELYKDRGKIEYFQPRKTANKNAKK